MEALQLALIAWHGLQLFLVLIGVGVEVAKQPGPAAEAAAVVSEPVLPRLDDTWRFTIPVVEDEMSYVRVNGAAK